MTKAFLIGAGATRAEYAAAPLSKDFFSKLKKKNQRLFTGIKDTIESHIGLPLEQANVEDVMTRSYDFSESVRTSFLHDLHLAIYVLLAEETKSTENQIDTYMRGGITESGTRFKKLLIDRRLDKNDFFMTLNYDLYLDREILTIQQKINYGLEDRYIKLVTNLPLSSDEHFSVYHLHGALNWELTGDKINVYRGAIRPKYGREGANLCIAPPGKKELNPILTSIWQIAEKRLLQADELIIIGCSLNPNDKELISLIEKFTKFKDNPVKIIHQEPSNIETTTNYQRVIGIDRKFEEFRHGFNINGPPGTPGAIEFIFQ